MPNAADDSTGQRRSFLESTQEFRRDLDRLRADSPDANERSSIDAIQAAFDGYLAVDKRVIEGLRTGTPASIKQATELVSGEALQWMDKIIQTVDKLVGDVKTDAAAEPGLGSAGAQRATSTIEQLGESSAEISQVVSLITEDISRRVQTIQQDTTAAVEAISEISEIISRISEHSTTIAAAVEEQTATTIEMSRNVSEAATGSGQIAENIHGAADAAQTTSSGVAESQRTADDLACVSAQLQRVVGQFQI